MVQLRQFEAGTDPATVLEAVSADGAAVITNLLPPDLLARVNEELAPWVQATPTGRDDFSGRLTTRTGALVARSPACREVVMDPTVVGMANQFLAPYTNRIQLHLTQVIRIQPGQGHQDAPPGSAGLGAATSPSRSSPSSTRSGP